MQNYQEVNHKKDHNNFDNNREEQLNNHNQANIAPKETIVDDTQTLDEEKNNPEKVNSAINHDINRDMNHKIEQAGDDFTKTINELKEKINSSQDKLLRSLAECENIRTRSIKMVEEARTYSITSFVKDLIPVMDNLSQALSHLPANPDPEIENMIQGIRMTKQELETVFKNHQVEAISPKPGEQFDYNLHNAISQLEHETFKEGEIIDTVQLGYRLRERLIRAAAVRVASQGTPSG